MGGAMTGFRPHLDYARPIGSSKRTTEQTSQPAPCLLDVKGRFSCGVAIWSLSGGGLNRSTQHFGQLAINRQ